MAGRDAGLRDYNEVSQRVAAFNEDYESGRIVTSVVAHHLEITEIAEGSRTSGKYRQPLAEGYVIVRAEVYRSAEDVQPAGVGHSWMLVPGITQYTRDAELENAETSAVGRALAMIGYYAKGGSLASNQEIAAKGGERGESQEQPRAGTQRRSRRATGTSDPAEASAEPKGITEKQRGLLESKMREAGVTGDKRKAMVLFASGKHSSRDLTSADLDHLLEVLSDREKYADIWENVDIVKGEDADAPH